MHTFPRPLHFIASSDPHLETPGARHLLLIPPPLCPFPIPVLDLPDLVDGPLAASTYRNALAILPARQLVALSQSTLWHFCISAH